MERLLTAIAATVATIVALALPLAYFTSMHEQQRVALDTEAEINARLIQAMIQVHPRDWTTYAGEQLRGPLAPRPGTGVPEQRSVLDATGRVVDEDHQALAAPLMLDSEDLVFDGKIVGQLIIARSLRPLIVQTMGVAIFGLLLGALMFLTLKVLPLRALQSAMADLEREQEETRQARDRAQAATRAKADFLANMSHEIRTPMNAIIGLTHLAMKTELTPRQRDYLQKVDASGRHLMGIIDDILDFSKAEAGKLQIEAADFEVDKLMANVANLVADKAAAKGLELIFDVGPEVPARFNGDSLRLSQVLVNFASNAVKFTDKGEVTIRVRAREVSADGMLLHFAVSDTGIGLTPQQASGLFESFQQADASTTRKFGGTGLGLAISKKLALLMGGDVGLQSEAGHGSTFWFTARVRQAQQAQPSAAMRPNMQGRRALVVDDNDSAREVIGDMLLALGFEVREAASGAQAVTMVRDADAQGKPFDILYLDWRMPALDGVATARQISALGLTVGPVVIMVTAYSREEVRREAELAGVHDVLVKPVTAALLRDATTSALETPETEAAVSAERHDGDDLAGLLATIRGARILLVEDNDINQIVATEILSDAGLVVEVAENGQEAVRMVQQSQYDLVLMDMQMPVMDGVTATREIRKLPGFAKLPIVAMTANAMEADRQRCLDAGMDGYVAKPFDPLQLCQVLLARIAPAQPCRA